jgi:hypothetical protein
MKASWETEMNLSARITRIFAALLPSLTDVMFFVPLFFIFTRSEGAAGLIEGDTGWHLRTGEWILANGRIPYSDMFSYSKPGEPWFAWEWLWDLGFALLHQHFGMPAVLLATIIVLCVTSVLLFKLTLRLCPYRLPAATLTFLAIVITSFHWWARPHVFTWLFTVMTLWVLEWKRSGERNLLWALPLLTILWVNIHGGFIVVLLILASYAAGEFLSGIIEPLASWRRESLRRSLPYILTALGCLAASLVNPYTYHLHRHIIRYVSDPSSPLLQHVSEWQSISFHMSVAPFVEAMIFVSLAAAFWHAAHRRFAYLFLIVGWIHLGLMSGRNLPIFALIAAPITAHAAVEMARHVTVVGVAVWIRRSLETLRSIDLEFGEIDKLPRLHLVCMAGLVLIGMGFYAPLGNEKLHADYSAERYPANALAKLSESDLSGRVFTDDEWGDYLIYRLYPKVKVFIDGRFDFYGKNHTEEYLDILRGKHNWEKSLAKFQIDSILLPVESQMTSTLKESGRWVPVYDDGVAILFHSREHLARISVQPKPGSAADHGIPAQAKGTPRSAHTNYTSAKGA